MRITYKMLESILQRIDLIYSYKKGNLKKKPPNLTLDECETLIIQDSHSHEF